ncbi:MAG: arylsulfotransferase family protein [Flavobacteriales bacterium]
MKRFVFVLLFVIAVINVSRAQQIGSSDFLELEVHVTDTQSVSPYLRTLDAVNWRFPDRSHAMVLGALGSPLVHIWSDGIPTSVIGERPRHLQWWSGQELFSMFYLGGAQALVSSDLEIYEEYAPNAILDGHAMEFTDDGMVLSLILTYQTVPDQNDDVFGDDIGVHWIEWLIEDSTGVEEIVHISEEYEALDLYSLGVHFDAGSPDTIIDPLHGNSIDYVSMEEGFYVGTTNRTLNEVLVMRQDGEGERQFYHFGGPLNQFSYQTDSVVAYRAHDFRFMDATDSTLTVSFFSNGDGESSGGTYAAGKIVQLNLQDLSVSLVSQSILQGPHSSAMGSYDPVTNTIGPGVVRTGENSFSTVLALDFDESGDEVFRIERSPSPVHFCYQANRYALEVDSHLSRPALDLSCDFPNNSLRIKASKPGIWDSYQFYVDDNLWNGQLDNDSTISLPIDFAGNIYAMSRLFVDDYSFTVDKYTDNYSVPSDFCNIVSVRNSAKPERLISYLKNQSLVLNQECSGTIVSVSGKTVLAFTGTAVDVGTLSSGTYVLNSDCGNSKFFVP